eukprot:TRINITY_DN1560_c0_g1_i1.p1 TRINITY_DN1560_c0_g1~~TRINITY_DN1560_c0_g1_i1.p1  ORF type:complete len:435 (+),score=119.77 TRINITY_DN1560_c0_g1_i1:152-1456(+)
MSDDGCELPILDSLSDSEDDMCQASSEQGDLLLSTLNAKASPWRPCRSPRSSNLDPGVAPWQPEPAPASSEHFRYGTGGMWGMHVKPPTAVQPFRQRSPSPEPRQTRVRFQFDSTSDSESEEVVLPQSESKRADCAGGDILREALDLGLEEVTVRDCLAWVRDQEGEVDTVDSLFDWLLKYQAHIEAAGQAEEAPASQQSSPQRKKSQKKQKSCLRDAGDADDSREDTVKGKTTYIVGIDSRTPEEVVLITLSSFGPIRKYQICGDPHKPTRYGFFEYRSADAAKKCQELKFLFGRNIRVSRAKDSIRGGKVISADRQSHLCDVAERTQPLQKQHRPEPKHQPAPVQRIVGPRYQISSGPPVLLRKSSSADAASSCGLSTAPSAEARSPRALLQSDDRAGAATPPPPPPPPAPAAAGVDEDGMPMVDADGESQV